MAIDCLSLSLFWSWPSTVSLSLLVMAIDCLSLSWLRPSTVSLSPGHGHRLSLSLLVMAIDCLSLSWLWPSTVSLSPGHGHRLSLSFLVMAIDCLSLPPLLVEICSLSLCFSRSWGFALSLALRIGSFSLLAMGIDSLSRSWSWEFCFLSLWP